MIQYMLHAQKRVFERIKSFAKEYEEGRFWDILIRDKTILDLGEHIEQLGHDAERVERTVNLV